MECRGRGSLPVPISSFMRAGHVQDRARAAGVVVGRFLRMVKVRAEDQFLPVRSVPADVRDHDIHEERLKSLPFHPPVQHHRLPGSKEVRSFSPWRLVRLKPNVTFFSSSVFGHMPVYWSMSGCYVALASSR